MYVGFLYDFYLYILERTDVNELQGKRFEGRGVNQLPSPASPISSNYARDFFGASFVARSRNRRKVDTPSSKKGK
jgi:hypothetical protein